MHLILLLKPNDVKVVFALYLVVFQILVLYSCICTITSVLRDENAMKIASLFVTLATRERQRCYIKLLCSTYCYHFTLCTYGWKVIVLEFSHESNKIIFVHLQESRRSLEVYNVIQSYIDNRRDCLQDFSFIRFYLFLVKALGCQVVF